MFVYLTLEKIVVFKCLCSFLLRFLLFFQLIPMPHDIGYDIGFIIAKGMIYKVVLIVGWET